MAATTDNGVERYLSIIAGCLARDLLDKSVPSDATTLQKAKFLESLGFTRDEAALFVGSTPRSIAELARQQKAKSKKSKKSAKKKGTKDV